MTRRPAPIVTAITLALVACGSGDDGISVEPAPTTATAPTVQRHPDIVDAVATFDPDRRTWSFAVTVSSPYDTPDRYADGWRIVGPDGTVFGVHTLAHDHADEQPFTRRQTGVEIPDDVDEVTIEGRDQKFGFGGAAVTILLQTGRP